MTAPKIVVPPFVITRAKEISSVDLPTSFLYYGPSGAGKTWTAGTAGDRTLYIDVGTSKRTILSKGFREKVGANPLIVTVIEDIGKNGIPDSPKAYDEVCSVIDFMLEHKADEFDTVVVDDATFLRRAALFKGLEFNQTTGKSKSMALIDEQKVVNVAVQDYGVEMDLIAQFLGYYVATITVQYGKNFILLAHDRLTTTKPVNSNGSPIIGATPIVKKISPGFTGEKFPDSIPAYFDWVFHAEPIAGNNKTVYRARTSSDGIVTAKNRDDGVFQVFIENPNFLEMIKKAKEAMK